MPPAFNLSQDQTLQFDLLVALACFQARAARWNRHLLAFAKWISLPCERLIFRDLEACDLVRSRRVRGLAHPPKRPHLSAVQFLKNVAVMRFDSQAAQKREYGVSFFPCQLAMFRPGFPAADAPHSVRKQRRRATIAQVLRAPCNRARGTAPASDAGTRACASRRRPPCPPSGPRWRTANGRPGARTARPRTACSRRRG